MAYRKLDPEFKTKWLKALRSGRYKQVSGTLRDDHFFNEDEERVEGVAYCCLGVACNILNPKAWKKAKDEYDYGFDWGDLPSSTTRKLPFCTPAVGSHLANMNDGGSTFVEIADWIEKKL